MQLSGTFWPNGGLALPLWELTSHLGNPGSSTGSSVLLNCPTKFLQVTLFIVDMIDQIFQLLVDQRDNLHFEDRAAQFWSPQIIFVKIGLTSLSKFSVILCVSSFVIYPFLTHCSWRKTSGVIAGADPGLVAGGGANPGDGAQIPWKLGVGGESGVPRIRCWSVTKNLHFTGPI